MRAEYREADIETLSDLFNLRTTHAGNFVFDDLLSMTSFEDDEKSQFIRVLNSQYPDIAAEIDFTDSSEDYSLCLGITPHGLLKAAMLMPSDDAAHPESREFLMQLRETIATMTFLGAVYTRDAEEQGKSPQLETEVDNEVPEAEPSSFGLDGDEELSEDAWGDQPNTNPLTNAVEAQESPDNSNHDIHDIAEVVFQMRDGVLAGIQINIDEE